MGALPRHVCLQTPPWLPHLQTPVLSMGLKRLDDDPWLALRPQQLQAYLDNKRQLSAALAECALRVLPGAEPAVRELAQLIAARRGKEPAAVEDATQCLYRSSLHVAEDLCLLQAGSGDAYYLQAAHLCAPSHWRLEDKIGRAMDPIHAPVPGYQPALARSVNRFLHKLKPGVCVQRFNWSLDATAQLCQRPAGEQHRAAPAPLAWYRVERQTLLRLPSSGAVVFSILVRHWPLWWLAQQPGLKAGLLQALESLPPALRDYKNLRDDSRLHWDQ